MPITVKGVEVRSKEVNTTVKVNFEDLTEEGQKRLFLEHSEEFVEVALGSKYPSVRKMLWNEKGFKEECSSITLNKAINECLKTREVVLSRRKGEPIPTKDIIALLDVPGFELDGIVREKLAKSGLLAIKMWIAKDKKTTTELLQSESMFWITARNLLLGHEAEYSELFEKVVLHPNFEWDEEMEEKMEDFCFSVKDAQKMMAMMQKLEKKRALGSFRKDGKKITEIM